MTSATIDVRTLRDTARIIPGQLVNSRISGGKEHRVAASFALDTDLEVTTSRQVASSASCLADDGRRGHLSTI